jgi:hypothetical protein
MNSFFLLIVATCFSCKLGNSSSENKNQSYLKNFSTEFRDDLLRLNKARIGLYPTLTPQYCRNPDTVGREYHLKALDNHAPYAPLYGRICIDKKFETAIFTLAGESGEEVAKITYLIDGEDIVFEAISENTSGCFISNKNWVFESREFTIPVVKRFFTMDWSYRDTISMCSSKSDATTGQSKQPEVYFRKRWFPTVIPGNEEWSVVSIRDQAKILAKVWTNPLKWSWAVEDFQDPTARVIRPEALFLLPVMNEKTRQGKVRSKCTC